MSSPQDRRHARIQRNKADPDDGNSWSCSACRLPIFSTPYISNSDDDGDGGTQVLLHKQCANLPEELEDCELHPEKPLLLRKNEQTSDTTCSECKEACGTKFYYCPDPDSCGFQLDVACALTVKILHWSHNHRLVAVRAGDKFLTCGVCGTKHEATSTSSARWSYLCNVCCFWIHPDCAALPNVIDLRAHEHPLVLNHDGRAPFGPGSSTAITRNRLINLTRSSNRDQYHFSCAICGVKVGSSVGIYCCIKCPYYVHIMCAVSDRWSFKPEARLPDLVRLPIPDEHKSYLILYGSGDGMDIGIHEHELGFHDGDDINCDDPHVCSACAKSISSPPFFSCPVCPDIFLHDCCRHLPELISPHPAHHKNHPFALDGGLVERDLGPDYKFICGHCNRPSNAFAYTCVICETFKLDVWCTFTPASITHDAHSNTHILYLFTATDTTGNARRDGWCDCCGKSLDQKQLGYECRTCHNFALHTWCAMLPNTVTRKFDQHPLKLITTTSSTTKWISSSESGSSDIHDHDKTVVAYNSCSSASQQAGVLIKLLCEICENGIDSKLWYYSCDICNQSFHIDCIPCLDQLSNIKFGSTARACPLCHDNPLNLIRPLALRGSPCDHCRTTFYGDNDMLALECSKCYFRIHSECARNATLASLVPPQTRLLVPRMWWPGNAVEYTKHAKQMEDELRVAWAAIQLGRKEWSLGPY